MTDKKIVSLQAVPKQAKPVEEEKKYKVSDEAIKDLSELLEKAYICLTRSPGWCCT